MQTQSIGGTKRVTYLNLTLLPHAGPRMKFGSVPEVNKTETAVTAHPCQQHSTELEKGDRGST